MNLNKPMTLYDSSLFKGEDPDSIDMLSRMAGLT